jgi:biopolymer transport protein ExbD
MLVNSHGPRARIDPSPLVDLTLALLVLCMVVLPVQLGHEVQVPPCGGDFHDLSLPPACPIILRMDALGRAFIGKELVPHADLAQRVYHMMQGREHGRVFFAADGRLPYGQVADFLDLCQRSGARNLGLVLDDLDWVEGSL